MAIERQGKTRLQNRQYAVNGAADRRSRTSRPSSTRSRPPPTPCAPTRPGSQTQTVESSDPRASRVTPHRRAPDRRLQRAGHAARLLGAAQLRVRRAAAAGTLTIDDGDGAKDPIDGRRSRADAKISRRRRRDQRPRRPALSTPRSSAANRARPVLAHDRRGSPTSAHAAARLSEDARRDARSDQARRRVRARRRRDQNVARRTCSRTRSRACALTLKGDDHRAGGDQRRRARRSTATRSRRRSRPSSTPTTRSSTLAAREMTEKTIAERRRASPTPTRARCSATPGSRRCSPRCARQMTNIVTAAGSTTSATSDIGISTRPAASCPTTPRPAS